MDLFHIAADSSTSQPGAAAMTRDDTDPNKARRAFDPPQAIPTRVGRYTVEGIIGRGAVGVVYKGHDPNISRPVALKTLRADVMAEVADREGLLARFASEARSAGRCQHPNIVTVHDYVEHQGAPFIVMEYLEASTLENVTRSRTLLPLHQVGEIMAQLLSALAHAHSKGVIHRDVKPANILCPAATSIKVGDFGVARFEDLGLTRGGSGMLGTPNYMAPEQFLGRPVDGRTDLFAAGIILFQLLTGMKPFAADDIPDLMRRLLNECPPSVTMLRPGLPLQLDTILAKALARNPADRFQTAGEFMDGLDASLATGVAEPGKVVDLTRVGARVGGDGPESSSSGLNKTMAERLSPSTLGSVEEALARSIGPIARIIVKRISREAFDTDALLNSLANQIPGNGEAEKFRKEAERSLRNDPGVTAIRLDAVISADQVRKATELLLPLIGPLARLIAEREAKNAIGANDYFDRLSRQLKSEDERRWFLSHQPVTPSGRDQPT